MESPDKSSDGTILNRLIEALHAGDNEHLLSAFKTAIVERVLNEQLLRAKGDAALAVPSAVDALKIMEASIERLHEHELLMDKAYFEELVKSEIFMFKGLKTNTGTPMGWVRAGYASRGIWRLKEGSPRAHAYIRCQLYILQYFYARMLTEGTCGSPRRPLLTVVYDLVQGRIYFLIRNLFDSLGADLIIVGVSPIVSVTLNMASKLMPFSAAKGWKLLESRDEIEDIVANVEDIPHWYYDEGDVRKERGARRCESDRREYGFWRRCLSKDYKLTLKDMFNPDPVTWLDDDGWELEGAPKKEENLGKLEVIGEEEGDEDGDDGL